MIKSKNEYRKISMDSAIASVKAEGFTLSTKAKETFKLYSLGKISSDEMKSRALKDVSKIAKRKFN